MRDAPAKRIVDADETYMALALEEAAAAAEEGEAPVGAVVVCDGIVVARSRNARESLARPHRSRGAARHPRRVGRARAMASTGCTVYVTLEPCPMCAGAMHAARVDRLVYGAADPKAGAVGSLYDLSCDERLNHTYEVRTGVLEDECSAILKEFFVALRNRVG